MLRNKFLLSMIMGFLASLYLAASELADQYSVKWGSPGREGRAWVERGSCSAPTREGGRLVLRADSGSVVVKTGASEKMECQVILRAYKSSEAEARRYFGGYELSIRALESGVYLEGRASGEDEGPQSTSAEFDITVPPRFSLDIETQGGDVRVESPLEGEVRATTAAGDIRTADVSGALRVETAGGSIKLGSIGQRADASTAGGSIRMGNVGGEATLETSGGDITVGHVAGALRAETAGGDVVIDGAQGPVVAQTAGGQIRIGQTGDSVHAETAGGSIWLQGARGRVDVDTAGGSIDLLAIQGAIKASTAAGRILAQIDASRKTFGASELENSMGDVQVYLPANLALTIDAAIEMAAGHQIVSDFPLVIRGSEEEYAEREIRGRGDLNGGGEVLRIRTVNGNIEIRKLDSQTLEKLREQQNAEWNRGAAHRAEKEKHRQRKQEEERRDSPPDEE
jgi:putative adhesin